MVDMTVINFSGYHGALQVNECMNECNLMNMYECNSVDASVPENTCDWSASVDADVIQPSVSEMHSGS